MQSEDILGKTAYNGNVSIFTKYGVTVYKEEDMLITCQRKTIIIGKRYERGKLQISLTQDHRAMATTQTHKGSKKKTRAGT